MATPFFTEMAIDAAPPSVWPAQTAVTFAAASACADGEGITDVLGTADAAGGTDGAADADGTGGAGAAAFGWAASELAPNRASATAAPANRVTSGLVSFMSSMQPPFGPSVCVLVRTADL